MIHLDRRSALKGGAALALASTMSLLDFAKAWAQTSPWKPEPGAQLSMLRWKYFVQSEDDAFVALMNAFTQATGVKVDITRESYEDVQPKAWVASAQKYGKSGDKWIAVPICYSGSLINYRLAASKKAGFSKFPDTTAAFLEYARAMKAQGTPGGMALGHASGDGNGWVHWALWAHGGQVVDANDKVILNSPETEKALSWTKQLYEHMIPGTASWNDAFNNKAFLAQEIHWTNNGISIYVAAQAD